MPERSADVVIVGSGPTGSAYARIIRRDWRDARILMVEAGPQLRPQAGAHLDNVTDLAERAALEFGAQGPERTARPPITRTEWEERRAGRHDASLLRRSGLFIANAGDAGENLFAGFSAANVGGMGTKWSTGCPTPSSAERVPFIAENEMSAALRVAEQLLGVRDDPRPGDEIAGAMRAKLAALFDAGRPPDRRVQPMPLAATPGPSGLTYHGTDVILGPMTGEPKETFELAVETTCRRVLHENGRVTGVELTRTGDVQSWQVAAGAVIVAGDSLHSPQLLYASDIRPDALGRYLNDHFQVNQLVEMDNPVPMRSMTWIPNTEGWPFSVTIAPASRHSLPFPPEFDGQPVGIGCFCASDVDPDNRLVFDEGRPDWRGLPSISIKARKSPGDLDRLERGKDLVRHITDAIGCPAPGFATNVLPVGSSLHYQGTMRMGATDDGTSVCDRNSRVWGFDNLYVAGNGVIPTVTATNPTLFSVALATLGARQVASNRRRA